MISRGEAVCAVPHVHDPERARHALPGLLVCAGHQASMVRRLAQLAPLHAALDFAVAGGSLSDGPVVSGSREVGIVPVDRVMTIRAAIRHKLASWAQAVAEEAPATLPNLTEEARPLPVLVQRRRKWHVINPRTGSVATVTRITGIAREVSEVQVLTGWLATWHDWLLAQPYVDDWAQDMADLHSEAWSCAYPSGRRWHVIAECPTAGCGGRLRAALGTRDDLLPDRVICTEEPEHTWEAGEWRVLRRSLPDRQHWLTIAALSQLYGIPARSLYRWAVQDGWTSVCPVPTDRWLSAARHPALYHVDQVEAAVNARRGELDTA